MQGKDKPCIRNKEGENEKNQENVKSHNGRSTVHGHGDLADKGFRRGMESLYPRFDRRD